MLGITEILILLVLGTILAIKYGGSKKNLPPGPRGLPILGNALQLMKDSHLQLSKWAREYGKIYSFKIGTSVAIVISDVKILKEVMSDTNFSTRPPMELAELLVGGPYGIVTTNGRAWEEQRRWSLRKLRDFGFGKTSMEGLIMEEVNEAVDIISKNGENPLKVGDILDLGVLNALWTLMNGERCKLTDPKIRQVLDAHHHAIEAMNSSGLGFAPWLKYIFPNALKNVELAADTLMTFCRDAVAYHWDTYDEDGTSRDFIDEYIAEIKKTTDEGSSFYKGIGRKNLEAVVSDMIQAGSETTSHTLTWMLGYLTLYPEVQRKIHEELDLAVGTSASTAVGLSNKPNLPYLEATINETLRYSSLVSNGVQVSCIQDKEVHGYVFPKDCWVIPNIYHIHHDPAVWGDPTNFRPERFLASDNKTVLKPEALIPFQVGRRQCIGESMARDTLLLFSANLLHQFNVTKLEKEAPRPAVGGMMLVPKSYHFIFKTRKIL